MTIEKKAQELLEAATGLINAVTAMVSDNKATTSAAPAPAAPAAPKAEKKATKKEIAAAQKAAKAIAGKVLKELGKEKLGELLAEFDAGKFSDLKAEPAVFKAFTEKAEAALEAPAATGQDDDLLGDAPAAEAVERTLEDVKGLLLNVNNSDGLGRDVTRQILADLGVTRLGELKKEKFSEAFDKAQAALNEAGAV